MPILSPINKVPPPPAPPSVTVTKPEYRTTVVDTKYTPESSLLTNIEGSPWIVTFYKQITADDNKVEGQNYSKEAIHQQYLKIEKMELRVTNPWTYSQMNDTKQSQATGGSNVYPFVIPNVGDMFIADIGDGREGVFQVNVSEARSLYKEGVHFIEYILIGYATDELRGDLQHKTVDTVVFVRDFLQYGQNPLVQPEDYAIILELQRRHRDILEQYLRNFVSNEFNTIVLPGQSKATYDHFLMKAMKKFFTSWDTYLITDTRILNCDGDNNMLTSTIWNAIEKRDKHLMKFVSERMGLISSQLFDNQAMLEGIYYSGIQYVVYPIDPDQNVDDSIKKRERVAGIEKIEAVPARKAKLTNAVSDTELDGFGSYGSQPNIPNIFPVLKDDYYIFSKAFYDEIPGEQSRLELAVRDYLNKKPQDNRVLLSLCNQYHAWGGLERFYYTPILLVLMRACVRRF